MEQIVGIVLGSTMLGTALAALINQLGESLRQKRKRKYDKTDRQDKDVTALKAGMKFILYDRVKWLGRQYISAGAVDFDDRRLLREMHGVYHNDLGGNGDLDNLMQQVDSLPLKE